jgi:hypothetical protein
MTTLAKVWKGGARLGSKNATWPFAQLFLTPTALTLRVAVLGTFAFAPAQVKKVESYGMIPFFGKGVRIHHQIPNYPEKVVFWYLCANPQFLVDEIRALGYGA